MESALTILVISVVLVALWIMVRDIRRIEGDLGSHEYIDPGTEHTCGGGWDWGWGGCDLDGGLDGCVGC